MGCGWEEVNAEMGIRISMSEEDTLAVWKFMIHHKILPVSEEVLYRLFSWAKIHSFPVDMETSLDSRAWDSLGFCLWKELGRGDASVPRLLPTQSMLSRDLRGRTQRESESTLVGTSELNVEERVPLGGWPSASPPRPVGEQSVHGQPPLIPPPHAPRVGEALPTAHPEQLSPAFLAHAQEGLKPLAAPLLWSAIAPTGAAVAPAPLSWPAQKGS